MAYKVVFNPDNYLLGYSNSDANETAFNFTPGLVWKTVTEANFTDIVDGKKIVDGFVGDNVQLSASPQDDSGNTDGVKLFKETLTNYITALKQKHSDFLEGHSNSFNSTVTASQTALNAIDEDTVVTWSTTADGDEYIADKYSPHQVLREANSAILHIEQLP